MIAHPRPLIEGCAAIPDVRKPCGNPRPCTAMVVLGCTSEGHSRAGGHPVPLPGSLDARSRIKYGTSFAGMTSRREVNSRYVTQIICNTIIDHECHIRLWYCRGKRYAP